MISARQRWMAAAVVLVSAGTTVSADRVKLRSGAVVEGMFIGADSKAVRVLLDDGRVSEVRIEDAAAIEFTKRPPPPPPAPPKPKPAAAAAAAPAPAPERRPAITVPAGTKINVRLTQTIEVDASQAGQVFKAIIDDPVMLNGSTVIPRGATAMLQAVNVQQSGTMKGSDKITLKMNAFSFGGQVYEVATSYVESKGKGEGKKSARKIGGGAGLGGIIGGIAGGGEGAAIGALVGGVAGAAMSASGQEHLKLPAETRLQFQLTSAVNVRP